MFFIFEISEYIKKSRRESDQSGNYLGVQRESYIRKRKIERRKGKAWGFFGKLMIRLSVHVMASKIFVFL